MGGGRRHRADQRTHVAQTPNCPRPAASDIPLRETIHLTYQDTSPGVGADIANVETEIEVTPEMSAGELAYFTCPWLMELKVG